MLNVIFCTFFEIGFEMCQLRWSDLGGLVEILVGVVVGEAWTVKWIYLTLDALSWLNQAVR